MSTFVNLTAGDDELAALVKTMTSRCAWLKTVPARHLDSGESMEVFTSSGRKVVVRLEVIRAEGKDIDDATRSLGERLNRHLVPGVLVLPTMDECPLSFEHIAGWTVARLHIGLGY